MLREKLAREFTTIITDTIEIAEAVADSRYHENLQAMVFRIIDMIKALKSKLVIFLILALATPPQTFLTNSALCFVSITISYYNSYFFFPVTPDIKSTKIQSHEANAAFAQHGQ